MNSTVLNTQSEASKKVYKVEEIAKMLEISLRGAYNFVKENKNFKTFRVGSSIRISKDSFDQWFENTISN